MRCMARQSTYTPEIAAKICARLAEGESLIAICADDDMPSRAAVYVWLESNTEFQDRYARARARQAEHFLDEIVQIADESDRDTIHGENGDSPNSEWIARSRLRVDTRKWVMSKLAPKKYGDKIDVTTGNESLNLTPEQRQAKLAGIAAAAAKRKLEAEDDGSDLV